MAAAFDPSRFWPAFKAAGMLVPAVLTPAAGGGALDLDVGYIRPGELRVDGTRSDEHEAEYQHDDAPALKEGDFLTLSLPGGAVEFKARENPYVSDIQAEGRDGYFRRVKLTRLA